MKKNSISHRRFTLAPDSKTLAISSAIILFLVVSFSASAAKSRSVTLGWDANPEQDIAGYMLYDRVGEEHILVSVIKVSDKPSYTIPKLPSGTHSYSVTAFSSTGVVSDFSDEITFVRGRVR
ncbi:MAG: fibronectin type III domain-containing protein [Spartobacteria bacterium]